MGHHTSKHIKDGTKIYEFTCGLVAYFIFKAKFEEKTNRTTNMAVCFIKLNIITNYHLKARMQKKKQNKNSIISEKFGAIQHEEL